MARFLFDYRQFAITNPSGGAEVGALLNFYTAETTSRITTYSAPTGGVANTNPVVADGNGVWPPIWIDAGQTIKWVRTDADGGSPVTIDDFNIPAAPPSISAELYAFLAASEPLEVENGGTGSTTAVNALAALGAMGLVGGTFTGQILQSGKGAYLYNGTSGQAHGGVFVTASGASDPTSLAGEIWLKYA
jgi:hypothetical protein